MKFHTLIYILFFIFSSNLVQAQEMKEVVIPFGDTNGQKQLKMRIFTGNIIIKGTDRKDILVKYRNSDSAQKPVEDESSKGLKKISGSNFELEMGSENNFAYIKSEAVHTHLEFEILVPKKIDLNIHKQIGEEIIIDNISGIINVENNVGNITITNVSGIVNASTNAGSLVIGFNKVTANKAMLFNNTAGEIDITLPSNHQATLKMKTQMGEIYSDLDIVIQPNTPSEESSNSENGFRYLNDNWTHATLNGGGSEIILKSKVGNIYLRKSK